MEKDYMKQENNFEMLNNAEVENYAETTVPEEQSVVEEPKKPFYKKTWFWTVVVVVVGVVLALMFGNYGTKNEMVKYNNEQIRPLLEEFVELEEKLAETISDNQNDDVTLAEELKKNIIPEMERLVTKVKEISPEDEQIKELHDICIDAFVQYRDSIVMLSEALSEHDEEKYEKAEDMLESSTQRAEEYQEKREELRKELKLELESE